MEDLKRIEREVLQRAQKATSSADIALVRSEVLGKKGSLGAVLRGLGVEMNLFHLVALILAAGLGLDYALFFEHAGDDRAEQLRTLHAVIVCSLTTLLVFALLALSSIPVLRAIGSTVAIGVFGNFVLALLIARQPVRADGT